MDTQFPTTLDIEPGCYVDGHWGWHGIAHMVDQFPDFATVSERRLVRAYDRGWSVGSLCEVVHEIADAIEHRISAALPDGMIAHWDGGEFFISPWCDDDPDCSDDTCACHS